MSQLNSGNMRSRMRMIVLYSICCAEAERTGKRCRVIGTDNAVENYLGFFTKYGDGGVDINPIVSLYKSEIYQLLDYFKNDNVIYEEYIDRVPSAGLWDGQTDEGELGHTYPQMELSIRRCVAGIRDPNNLIDKFVWERHINNLHKNEMPFVIDLRKFCDF